MERAHGAAPPPVPFVMATINRRAIDLARTNSYTYADRLVQTHTDERNLG